MDGPNGANTLSLDYRSSSFNLSISEPGPTTIAPETTVFSHSSSTRGEIQSFFVPIEVTASNISSLENSSKDTILDSSIFSPTILSIDTQSPLEFSYDSTKNSFLGMATAVTVTSTTPDLLMNSHIATHQFSPSFNTTSVRELEPISSSKISSTIFASNDIISTLSTAIIPSYVVISQPDMSAAVNFSSNILSPGISSYILPISVPTGRESSEISSSLGFDDQTTHPITSSGTDSFKLELWTHLSSVLSSFQSFPNITEDVSYKSPLDFTITQDLLSITSPESTIPTERQFSSSIENMLAANSHSDAIISSASTLATETGYSDQNTIYSVASVNLSSFTSYFESPTEIVAAHETSGNTFYSNSFLGTSTPEFMSILSSETVISSLSSLRYSSIERSSFITTDVSIENHSSTSDVSNNSSESTQVSISSTLTRLDWIIETIDTLLDKHTKYTYVLLPSYTTWDLSAVQSTITDIPDSFTSYMGFLSMPVSLFSSVSSKPDISDVSAWTSFPTTSSSKTTNIHEDFYSSMMSLTTNDHTESERTIVTSILSAPITSSLEGSSELASLGDSYHSNTGTINSTEVAPTSQSYMISLSSIAVVLEETTLRNTFMELSRHTNGFEELYTTRHDFPFRTSISSIPTNLPPDSITTSMKITISSTAIVSLSSLKLDSITYTIFHDTVAEFESSSTTSFRQNSPTDVRTTSVMNSPSYTTFTQLLISVSDFLSSFASTSISNIQSLESLSTHISASRMLSLPANSSSSTVSFEPSIKPSGTPYTHLSSLDFLLSMSRRHLYPPI